jgi:hypothetical protein
MKPGRADTAADLDRQAFSHMSWLCLFVAIASEDVATSALKAADGLARLVPSLVVVMGYEAAFYLNWDWPISGFFRRHDSFKQPRLH